MWRRGRDLNPRGVTPTGLAGRRPTRLGDPGIHVGRLKTGVSGFKV